MANFKICVFEHQERTDGLFPVSIRVYWKAKSAYIKTEYHVSKKQIKITTKTVNNKIKYDYELKDNFIIRELLNRISQYEDIKVRKLGQKIDLYTAKELAEYFVKKTSQSDTIDFLLFSYSYIENLEKKGNIGTAKSLKATVNGLRDFVKNDTLNIQSVTAKMLTDFVDYLKTNRKITRLNQFGKPVTTDKKPLSAMSIKDYMTNIRTLFNAARDYYNDPDKDEVKIAHYPFAKFKINRTPTTQKKALSVNDIKAIRDMPKLKVNGSHGTNRACLSRDLFMMSIYLLGTNAVDLYNLDKINGDRIEYKRAKTKDRRQDEAFISIKIEHEALPLIEKYKDKTGKRAFCFYQLYADAQTFSSNIAIGLKQVAKSLNMPPFTYYAARHSYATIASNDCEISKDIVHETLNHSDSNMKMTDIYIKKDWSKNDKANRKFLDMLLS
jgi:integrase